MDQFSEGQIYLKQIRFGSNMTTNDILGVEPQRVGDVSEFGGTLLVKIQLLRDEEA